MGRILLNPCSVPSSRGSVPARSGTAPVAWRRPHQFSVCGSAEDSSAGRHRPGTRFARIGPPLGSLPKFEGQMFKCFRVALLRAPIAYPDSADMTVFASGRRHSVRLGRGRDTDIVAWGPEAPSAAVGDASAMQEKPRSGEYPRSVGYAPAAARKTAITAGITCSPDCEAGSLQDLFATGWSAEEDAPRAKQSPRPWCQVHPPVA